MDVCLGGSRRRATPAASGVQDIFASRSGVNAAPMKSDHKVLILSNDVMAAALVGGLVEAARFSPAFAEAGESGDEALARVRPILAILIDALADSARSDLFLARARSRKVAVAAFCPVATKHEHARWAEDREVVVFGLPDDSDKLASWLSEGEASRRAARPRAAQRRAPSATRHGDGTLVLLDPTGVRWAVYDRRAADRRGGMERHFVNDAGEDRACTLAEDELQQVSAIALVQQLERASRVP